MNNFRHYLINKILFIALIISPRFLWSQNDALNFHHLGVNEGLSSSNTLCLHQDHLKRIWVGTMDGLNMYDGQRVKIFQPSEASENSLLGHHVKKIIQQQNKLWILTNSGVSSLDLTTLKFQQYPIQGALSITTYHQDILISSYAGLKIINEQKNTLEEASILKSEKAAFSAFFETDHFLYAVSYAQRIYILDKKTQSVKKEHIPEMGQVNQILVKDGSIWIASYNNGLIELTQDLQIKNHFQKDAKGIFKLNHNSVRTVKIDTFGKIWIGTFLGLHLYDPYEGKNDLFASNPLIPGSLSHHSIWDIIEDHQNSIWLATYYGGLSYVNPKEDLYKRYYHEVPSKNKLGHNVLGQMVEDEQNNLWIATEGGGLDYFDRKANQIINYGWFNSKNEFEGKNIKSLWLDQSKTLYAGTHEGGLFQIDLEKKSVYTLSQSNKYRFSVNDIKPFQNNLLLATSNGVFEYNLRNKEYTNIFENWPSSTRNPTGCSAILIDHQKKLWIGTKNDGIFIVDTSSKKITNLNKTNANLFSNDIFKLYQDSQNKVWVATTGGGLSLYDEKTQTFRSFTQQSHGLPSNQIHGFLESKFENYWIATSKGLVRLDMNKEVFFTFDHESGFPMREINQSSLLLTKDGQLFIGGTSGLVSFQEQTSIKKINVEKPYISELVVNNQTIDTQNSQILQKDIPFQQSIVLQPEHTSFALYFTSSDYIQTFKNKFSYQLIGFDKDWIDAKGKNYASYTNLAPGKYTFLVRSYDPQYTDNFQESQLTIVIEPPFYKTNFAYLLYFLIVVLIVVGANYFYLNRTRLIDQLNFEKKSKEQLELTNNQKLEFFTNVSHEFITPLSIINGTLEGIIENNQLPKQIQNRIQIAFKSSNRLKNLAKELLDFRKLEKGHLKIQVFECDFSEFLTEIVNSYEKIAADKHIKYNLIMPEEPIYLTFDPEQMEKVFFNLLSNSFKHVATTSGEINVEVKEFQDFIEVKIQNNGEGIPENEIPKIFDRFYQIENLHQQTQKFGTGIGLSLAKGIVESHRGEINVESDVKKGSSFYVRLQKGKSHFMAANILQMDEIRSFRKIEHTLYFDDEEAPSNMVSKNAPKILLVDDNEDFRGYISSFLHDSFNIFHASNGLEGLNLAINELPDLIISDVVMPIMTGTQMLEKLKRNLSTAHIPIILLTAKIETDLKIEGLENGADDYLSKPINPKILKTKVFNLLNNRKLVQDNIKDKKKIKIKKLALSNEDTEFLAKAKSFVESNLSNENLNVSDLTYELGLSRTKLYQKIKKVTHKTPNEFILDIRLQKAAKLLIKNPDLPIADIAYQTGFSTARYFSQCFKNHFGVSPSHYIQNQD
jgi:signal transduction histidine kinase/ligand-binding sensor domain-containing protein/DNA-binding response OmpR family regulator